MDDINLGCSVDGVCDIGREGEWICDGSEEGALRMCFGGGGKGELS